MITLQQMIDRGCVPCDIFDGDGNQIDLKIVAFDPVSGEVEHFVTDSKGDVLLTADHTAVERTISQFKPPLTWKRL